MSGVNDCPRCGADMVLPERVCIICLVAENARLRGELVDLEDARALVERIGWERIETLTADLARVTGERDDLKEWKVLHAELSGDLLARVTAERDRLVARVQKYATWLRRENVDERVANALDGILAACASPASGEVKP